METVKNFLKDSLEAIRHKLRVWLGVVHLEVHLENKLIAMRSKQINELYIDKKMKDLEHRVAEMIEFDNAKLRGEVNQVLLKFYKEKLEERIN